MGWWKIRDVETGQIAYGLPSGHPADAPVNAVPGRDDPQDQYNGDGPADSLANAIKQVENEYQQAWGRLPFPAELRACFNFVFNGWLRRHDAQRPAT